MSTPERAHFAVLAVAVAVVTALPCALAGERPDARGAGPRLGQPAAAAQVARWDLDVFPDGQGLPPGRGSAVEGGALFRQHCAACHGATGRGASAEELAGGSEPLTSEFPDKTIGLYWPYATTLFDFIRRAKPMTAPGTLKPDEVYALTAWLLYANGVIGERDVLDPVRLPRVRMPNRDGFVGVDAPLPSPR